MLALSQYVIFIPPPVATVFLVTVLLLVGATALFLADAAAVADLRFVFA